MGSAIGADDGRMTPLTRYGILALTTLLLTACAMQGDAGREPVEGPSAVTTPVDAPPGTPSGIGGFVPPAAEGEVIGQGTVLQVEGGPPMFCLGLVQESYPPQCSGPELVGWDWDTADQEETASGVTWGTYAVTGTWDGTSLTTTAAPIPLSLHDPLPLGDPLEDRQGTSDPQELDRIQQTVFFGADGHALTSVVERGFVTVTVVYDDGSFQQLLDAEYGPDVVVVLSALRHAR